MHTKYKVNTFGIPALFVEIVHRLYKYRARTEPVYGWVHKFISKKQLEKEYRKLSEHYKFVFFFLNSCGEVVDVVVNNCGGKEMTVDDFFKKFP